MAIQDELELDQRHRGKYPDISRLKLGRRGTRNCEQQRAVPEKPYPRDFQLAPISLSYRAPFANQLSLLNRQSYQQSYGKLEGGCLLEALPKSIIDSICRYVPYENLIALRQMSRRLYALVDQYHAPLHTMMSFVLRAERDFAKHRLHAPYNLGCYTCFRVLPPGQFASNQPPEVIVRDGVTGRQVVVSLRRYCVDCGLRAGYHGPGDYLERPTGQRSWICNCGDVIDWQVKSKCDVCRAICPFRPAAAARNNARRSYGQVNASASKLRVISSLNFQQVSGYEIV